MAQTPHIELKDGRRLDFSIRTSHKSRSVRLKLDVRGGLLVTAPIGVPVARIIELVVGRSDWIGKRLTRLDEVGHRLTAAAAVRPHAIDLPALCESWRVEYRETRAKTVVARADRSGRIVVSGAVEDARACQAALRRWLARRAKQTLLPWLESVSEETGLRFSGMGLKNQRTRWGSCTADGRINLNCKLLFLPRELVRYVLIHELCHTLVQNHSSRFWAMVRRYEPKTDALRGRMRDGWRSVPVWAKRV
ncbi:MAG: M48 family metallopeptidase [Pseudomonadota bacterium]|nr:M48 family metallopeptidase [Pseudomonadota bacterium]